MIFFCPMNFLLLQITKNAHYRHLNPMTSHDNNLIAFFEICNSKEFIGQKNHKISKLYNIISDRHAKVQVGAPVRAGLKSVLNFCLGHYTPENAKNKNGHFCLGSQ